ncbi:phosphatidylserine decarboxylase [Lysinibacillus agricola]|uniref:phosphatidylserine decarboxylase n=1 Tax=Lysinibacillus agricola TaxID=2590012 RepID=A0ABX7ARA9_9BACI|nr:MULTISPECIES: phosphatidylserine decarboxylase [Lysinibacillus]KOS61010.1 phosphatidylserine decarboxylase [Lysinibacillus sp. FJAT-14222]QQP11433.1 phosphatidylserine decarboxylase [Lysinibacillus agricola]
MKEKLYQRLIELTNGKQSSQLLQTIAKAKWSKRIIPSYMKVYDIKLEEVSKKQQQFSSLHDFFTRELLEDARPIEQNTTTYVSPVDAKIESFGRIEWDMTFLVKGKPYALQDLLGNTERAAQYADGHFIVFYLSPADYHRIHSPIDGRVLRQYTLGQKSYPVNQLGLTYGRKPISHNYRSVTELKVVKNQQVAFIKVGATFVNSIVLTNTTTQWRKGEEIGYFSFGSTVVMLFEKDAIEFTDNVVQGSPIRMGEAFANML